MAETIANQILAAIQAKSIDASSAISIIVKSMEIVETFPADLEGADKRHLVVRAIEIIAAGKDGVAGTADDLIKPDVVAALKLLVASDLVGDIVDNIVRAVRGYVKVHKFSGCFSRWCA